ncbi:MAG TPA: SagB/ThcOx family dehydrogenase [Desulfobacteria bacterium]|nr:SagB/ThcOx family dehydrogenase [Desulfobacteria bacterium]
MPTKTVTIGVIAALVVITAIATLAFSNLIPHKQPKPAELMKTNGMARIAVGERITLPNPRSESDTSVEAALAQRRSIRAYSGENLTIDEISQLLWAAQGITAPWGGRTAPSAGALYPLELYVVIGDVEGVDDGVYRYRPANHTLEKVRDGDVRAELADAALGQNCIRDAAIDIVFTAVYERTTGKYRERGVRYVQLEAGHAAQNVYLQAVALDLGTVTIGAFTDSEVTSIMNLQEQEDPLYIMPVGRKG